MPNEAMPQPIRHSLNAHREASLLGPARQAWHGFPLEWLRADPWTELRDFGSPVPVLAMMDSGQARARFDVGRRTHDIDVDAGSMGYFPPGTHFRHIRWECQSATRIVLSVDFERLAALGLQPIGQPARLGIHLKTHDPSLAQLLRSMVTEVASGCVNGPLYAESLSVGVVSRLVTSLGQQPGALADKGRLTRAQLCRVVEQVEANMDKDLSLEQLARVTGYSPAHFVRLCKNTLGVTPHQYVLQVRLQRAHEEVKSSSLSLAQVAEATGFSSQSHMTSAFVAAFGITPGALRRERGCMDAPVPPAG
jgi:AraC family transcriptional regulator